MVSRVLIISYSKLCITVYFNLIAFQIKLILCTLNSNSQHVLDKALCYQQLFTETDCTSSSKKNSSVLMQNHSDYALKNRN